ncbi:CYCLIN domain-containing protein [Mycena indigotica]|uniref:CYCLIN domain-containing protein n=1 Tax=Mycena indigotica TaxID=2126181 RepID=A0A8H6W0Z7_9AGAR|nr:CYCLIN domain-containing protein [Mycena indigotica]KAF7300992.1 CYCLIN domain-containing protein [Mycena indigotica]
MATDFWSSSHYKRWIVDRATLRQARAEDLLYVEDPEHLDFLAIYFAEVVAKLGRSLHLAQRAIATATVFFRRFYLKNSYCETDPFIVAAACCYLASKAEEFPVHIKNVVSDARRMFGQEPYNVKTFPTDNTKLAEMEFYLVDDLDCDLTVFHPYRTLLTLCKSAEDQPEEESEAGEVGVGVNAEDGSRYWGTGQGQLELPSGGLQTAWFIINDTFRSELCLLYPPHLIAIAAIYLTCVFNPATQSAIAASHEPTPTPRRSSRHAADKSSTQDPLTFLAGLNVSLPLVATIAQEIIAMYTLWERYRDKLSEKKSEADATPPPVDGNGMTAAMLTDILTRMREARMQDHIQQQGRQMAVNRILERTQGAG